MSKASAAARRRANERSNRNRKLYKTPEHLRNQKRMGAAKNGKSCYGRWAFAPSRGTMNGHRL